MSASNWARCPKCLKDAKEVLSAQLAKVNDSYGKVPVEKFDTMREKFRQDQEFFEDDQNLRTFREDYDISGAEDGLVVVGYKGNCTKCKLKLEFEMEQHIPGFEHV